MESDEFFLKLRILGEGYRNWQYYEIILFMLLEVNKSTEEDKIQNIFNPSEEGFSFSIFHDSHYNLTMLNLPTTPSFGIRFALVISFILAIIKGIVGILSGSLAILGSALDSLMDMFVS